MSDKGKTAVRKRKCWRCGCWTVKPYYYCSSRCSAEFDKKGHYNWFWRYSGKILSKMLSVVLILFPASPQDMEVTEPAPNMTKNTVDGKEWWVCHLCFMVGNIEPDKEKGCRRCQRRWRKKL